MSKNTFRFIFFTHIRFFVSKNDLGKKGRQKKLLVLYNFSILQLTVLLLYNLACTVLSFYITRCNNEGLPSYIKKKAVFTLYLIKMIHKIVVCLLFLITISAFSQQEKINNYKYILVPEKFEFLKKSDQYQTSSLTKFLLAKKGFVVFLSTDKNIPEELFFNKCLALTAKLIDDSNLFMVKNRIELKDCHGTILYASAMGKSKEKDFKKSYHEAIRNAYSSMDDLAYEFTPKKENTNTEVVTSLSEIVTLPIAPAMKEATPV